MPEIVPALGAAGGIGGRRRGRGAVPELLVPPRYLANCSQAVLVDRDGPVLIHNYDLDPALNEGRRLKSALLGRDVIGMVEGMAGLSDGMNTAALPRSLSFGGRAANTKVH